MYRILIARSFVRLVIAKSGGLLSLIYLGTGCTSQGVTEYVESGRAQEDSDAAVSGLISTVVFVLSNPIDILVGLLLLAIFAILALVVGYLICKSARRSRGGL